MSTFTTEVRFICEMEAGLLNSQGMMKVQDIINASRPKIFDFDYPIFNPNYREVLETKILMHFYTREICCETYGLWKLRLWQKLNEIMPYYNQLYLSEMLKFDPLLSDNYKRTGNRVDNRNTAQTEIIGDETGVKHDSKTDTTQNTHGTSKEQETETSSGNTTGQTSGKGNTSGTNNSKTVTENSGTSTNNGTTDSKGTSENTQTNAYSDTPQNQLSDVAKLKYITDYRVIGDNGSTTGNVTTKENGSTKDSGTSTTTADTGEKSETSGNSAEQRQDNSSRNQTGETTGDMTGSSVTGETTEQTYQRNRSLNIGENETGNYWETIIGYRGRSATSLLMEYRESFLNIDQMILKELEPLFFGLWF